MTTQSETLFRAQISGRSIACAHHDAGGDTTVIFSHGFRGEKTGPNRTFVRTARLLAASGISSLRFDQYGSGDSDGDFLESRFGDWIDTIVALARQQLDAGQRIALFGQSMGASAAICAAARFPAKAVVAWVPDANVEEYTADPRGYMEEGGQRVGNSFWQEAYAADVRGQLPKVPAPCYLVFGTADEYVSAENREALVGAAKSADRVDVFEGYSHSGWTADQADDIIARSVNFLTETLAN